MPHADTSKRNYAHLILIIVVKYLPYVDRKYRFMVNYIRVNYLPRQLADTSVSCHRSGNI